MGKENKEKSCRILFVLRYFYPFIGGMENKALNIASCLRKKGMDVSVVTSRFEKDWQKEETIKGVPVIRLPSPKIKIIGALIFLFNLSFYLFKNHKQFQIIHVFQMGYSSAVAIFISRALKKTSLLSLAASGSGGDIKRHLKTPWGLIFIFFCRLASKIVILNRQMEKELRIIQYNVENMVYIPNGVDTKVFYPGKKRTETEIKGKHIVFTGRLTRQKSLDILIEAFSKLRNPNVELHIIGDGPERLNLFNLARQQCSVEKIRFPGEIKDVSGLLRKSDLFVLPSHYEGMSNAMLEAMACGVPVIASDIPGNHDIINNEVNGLLFKENNVGELAEKMESLLTEQQQAGRLAENALDTVIKKHSMQIVADKYIQLYEGLFK